MRDKARVLAAAQQFRELAARSRSGLERLRPEEGHSHAIDKIADVLEWAAGIDNSFEQLLTALATPAVIEGDEGEAAR